MSAFFCFVLFNVWFVFLPCAQISGQCTLINPLCWTLGIHVLSPGCDCQQSKTPTNRIVPPTKEKVDQSSIGVNRNARFYWHYKALKFKSLCIVQQCSRYIMIAYVLFTVLAILPLLVYLWNSYFVADLTYAITALRIAMRISKIKKEFYSLLDRFLDKVARHPDKKFIIFEDSSYTYSQVDKQSNKVARALAAHAHLKEGDTVALFSGNEPQVVWVWLGLAKLGCVAALLNCNIRSKSLLHCFSCCEAKVLIAASGEQRHTVTCKPYFMFAA